MTSAAIAYEGRQISFTPGVSMVAMKTAANSFVAIGVVVGCAMKFACVRAEPVATTLAPLTISPASVSRSTCTYTSATSSGGRAIDGRLDEGVVQEEHALLRGAVPAPRVVLIRGVEV